MALTGFVESVMLSVLLGAAILLIDIVKRHWEARNERKRHALEQKRVLEYLQHVWTLREQKAQSRVCGTPSKVKESSRQIRSFIFLEDDNRLKVLEKKRKIALAWQWDASRASSNLKSMEQDREYEKVKRFLYRPVDNPDQWQQQYASTSLEVPSSNFSQAIESELNKPATQHSSPSVGYEGHPGLTAIQYPINHQLFVPNTYQPPYPQPNIANCIHPSTLYQYERMIQYNHAQNPFENLYNFSTQGQPHSQPTETSSKSNTLSQNQAQAPGVNNQQSSASVFASQQTLPPAEAPQDTLTVQVDLAPLQLSRQRPTNEPSSSSVKSPKPPLKQPKQQPFTQSVQYKPTQPPAQATSRMSKTTPSSSLVSSLLPIFQPARIRPLESSDYQKQQKILQSNQPEQLKQTKTVSAVKQIVQPLSPQYPPNRSPQYPNGKTAGQEMEDSESDDVRYQVNPRSNVPGANSSEASKRAAEPKSIFLPATSTQPISTQTNNPMHIQLPNTFIKGDSKPTPPMPSYKELCQYKKSQGKLELPRLSDNIEEEKDNSVRPYQIPGFERFSSTWQGSTDKKIDEITSTLKPQTNSWKTPMAKKTSKMPANPTEHPALTAALRRRDAQEAYAKEEREETYFEDAEDGQDYSESRERRRRRANRTRR